MQKQISKETTGKYTALNPMVLGSHVQWTEGINNNFTQNYLGLAQKQNIENNRKTNNIFSKVATYFIKQTHQSYYWTGSKNISSYYSCYIGEKCTINTNRKYETWLEHKPISRFAYFIRSPSPRFKYSLSVISLTFWGPGEIQLWLNTIKWWIETIKFYQKIDPRLSKIKIHKILLPLNSTHEEGIIGFNWRDLPIDIDMY